jgi:hypothetical protein
MVRLVVPREAKVRGDRYYNPKRVQNCVYAELAHVRKQLREYSVELKVEMVKFNKFNRRGELPVAAQPGADLGKRKRPIWEEPDSESEDEDEDEDEDEYHY